MLCRVEQVDRASLARTLQKLSTLVPCFLTHQPCYLSLAAPSLLLFARGPLIPFWSAFTGACLVVQLAAPRLHRKKRYTHSSFASSSSARLQKAICSPYIFYLSPILVFYGKMDHIARPNTSTKWVCFDF